jgi:hypothetical protein
MRRFIRFLCVLITIVSAGAALAASSGAVFTSDASCDGTNENLYASKDDVYLNGGPAQPGAAGLDDGAYFVQVTVPNGDLLGYSLTAAVNVTGGSFDQCYHLVDILVKASDGTTPGFDDTTNNGGEYKVWVSKDAAFPNNATKTDNFKVKDAEVIDPGSLFVQKFYDANADGLWTAGEPEISGWEVTVTDAPHAWNDAVLLTPAEHEDEPGLYTVTESMPVQLNWRATTPVSVTVSIVAGQTTNVTFGNLCLGAGGGLTLGFWSNKNGAALYNNAVAVAQNLRDASGNHFDPSNHKTFRTWILNASATNMAYMLSAQLAAMTQNVANGNVSGSALVYAPGTGAANPLGYATISGLIAEANALLAANGYTVAAGPDRTAQEAVKNALDYANNNYNFVQAGPCVFSF